MTGEALRVLEELCKIVPSLQFDIKSYDFGGIAIDKHQTPLPPATLEACQSANAILLGAVGTFKQTLPFLVRQMSISQIEILRQVDPNGVQARSDLNKVFWL